MYTSAFSFFHFFIPLGAQSPSRFPFFPLSHQAYPQHRLILASKPNYTLGLNHWRQPTRVTSVQVIMFVTLHPKAVPLDQLQASQDCGLQLAERRLEALLIERERREVIGEIAGFGVGHDKL